jgi:hypothetical protein
MRNQTPAIPAMKKQTPRPMFGGIFTRGFQISLLAMMTFWPPVTRAFPPAPDHLLFGQVRDELGNILSAKSATVYLETDAGVRIKTQIISGLEPGVNYKLSVPMDSGLTSDQYKPTALHPAVPFKMWVTADGTTYLPIEMQVKSSSLGAPGGKTRIDLTLGVDADGDGLPDAWERAMIAALGLNIGIADFRPGDDSDHDGMSNLNEYIAGTYAFDPADGFGLKIAGYTEGTPVLEFLGIRGRSYSVLGSDDMVHWSPVAFKLSGSTGPAANDYYAADVRMLRVEVSLADSETAALKFFKLIVR